MIMQLFYSFLCLGCLGMGFGLLLAFTGKILEVKKDERLEQIEVSLPGINCGGCGYAGCASYAQAIITKGADLTLCGPGGVETKKKLALIMGKHLDLSTIKIVTQVFCKGNKTNAKYRFSYTGIEDCNGLHMLFGGDKICPYGCLAQGSCIKVCPVDAITYDKHGLVTVNKEICISCNKCITVCPTKVIKVIPYNANYFVACNNVDQAADVKKYCSVGCTGCKLCEKSSPDGGFKVINNLASIDYKYKGDRKKAAEKCPAKCIILNQ